MQAISGKRKRVEVPSKSKRLIKRMNNDDKIGDYLDFLSHIGNDKGTKSIGGEDSYLHDESLLVSPMLTDYVNRSNASSSAGTYGTNLTSNTTNPSSKSTRCSEEYSKGRIADERSRDGNLMASSPVRRENLHSVWQLDASTCPSLGLGSTTSTDSSQNMSDIAHHTTHNLTKSSTSECEYNETCTNREIEINLLEIHNNSSKHAIDDDKGGHTVDGQKYSAEDDKEAVACLVEKESRVSIISEAIDDGYEQNYRTEYQNITRSKVVCDDVDDSIIEKTRNDGSSLDIGSDRSRLSNIAPQLRQGRHRNDNLSTRESEEGQASSHFTEKMVSHTKPQHNSSIEVDEKIQQTDTDQDGNGYGSRSPPPSDCRDTNKYAIGLEIDAPPCLKTPQRLQNEEKSIGVQIKSGDRNSNMIGVDSKDGIFSPIIGSPISKFSNLKTSDGLQTDNDATNEKHRVSDIISQKWKNFVDILTPSKESKDEKLQLSPALKDSLSKNLMRKNHGDENENKDDLRNRSEQVGNQLLDNDNEHSFSRSISNIELSLTPALNRLRSKMGMMGKTHDDEIVSSDTVKDITKKHIKFENQEEDLSKTPTNTRSEHIFQDINTPSSQGTYSSSNLTPGLQALKSRINLYSSDEDNNTPQSLKTGSGISVRKSPITPLYEDDSYLEQPKDLSSARKKLTAQSSALVERLRGAAQRRKMQLSRSRNSILREQKYLMTLETNDDSIYSPEAESQPIDAKHENDSPVTETLYKHFKARPLPATTLAGSGGHSGVPKVRKRQATIAKSPLLGSRRISTTKSKSRYTCSTIEKELHRSTGKEKSISKSSVRVPIKTRRVPASTGMIKSSGQKHVSKMKKRITSLPNTPCNVFESKKNELTKSTLHSAVAKVNANINGNSERRSISKKSSIGQDATSFSGGKTNAELNHVKQTRSIENRENIPPFTLYSTVRAEERATFDACRLLNEKSRQERLTREREVSIKEKRIELTRLKETLR